MTELTICYFPRQSYSGDIIKILEKTINMNKKMVWYIPQKEDLDEVDSMLWTYSQLSFLPHANSEDPFTEYHPVLLANNPVNLNTSHEFLAMSRYLPTKSGGESKIILSLEEMMWANWMSRYEKIIVFFTIEDDFPGKEVMDDDGLKNIFWNSKILSSYKGKVKRSMVTYFDQTWKSLIL